MSETSIFDQLRRDYPHLDPDHLRSIIHQCNGERASCERAASQAAGTQACNPLLGRGYTPIREADRAAAQAAQQQHPHVTPPQHLFGASQGAAAGRVTTDSGHYTLSPYTNAASAVHSTTGHGHMLEIAGSDNNSMASGDDRSPMSNAGPAQQYLLRQQMQMERLKTALRMLQERSIHDLRVDVDQLQMAIDRQAEHGTPAMQDDSQLHDLQAQVIGLQEDVAYLREQLGLTDDNAAGHGDEPHAHLPPAMSAPANLSSPPPPPGSWSCPRCTLYNENQLEMCQMCDTARPRYALITTARVQEAMHTSCPNEEAMDAAGTSAARESVGEAGHRKPTNEPSFKCYCCSPDAATCSNNGGGSGNAARIASSSQRRSDDSWVLVMNKELPGAWHTDD